MSAVTWLLALVAAFVTYPIAAGAWAALMFGAASLGLPLAGTGVLVSPFVGAIAALAVASRVVRR